MKPPTAPDGNGNEPTMAPPPSRAARRGTGSGAEARAELIGRIAEAAGAELAPELVDRMLAEAKLTGGAAIRVLLEHLRSDPTAFTAPSAHCPRSLVVLLVELNRAGHGAAITLASCAACGRAGVKLPTPSAAGRLCAQCGTRLNHRPCGRCATPAQIITRLPDGTGLCRRCYRDLPERLRPCAGCGERRHPVRRTGPESWLCQSCSPRPLHDCSRCGTRAPAHILDESWRPVCQTCYAQPRRTCGKCGLVAPIAKRATGDHPDLCSRCYPGPVAECSVCLRTRSNVTRFRGGDLICSSCRPRPHRTCAACKQDRPIRANWPLGPTCDACYVVATRFPGPCARCARTKVLVGRDADGEGLCGACCGVDIDFTCRTCSHPGDIHTDGRCTRCVVTDRITDLLSNDGKPVAPQLLPLAEAMIRARHPHSVLGWLRTAPAAQLLTGLVADHTTIAHSTLDALPPSRHVDSLRMTLVATGALAPRQEQLDRLTSWLRAVLADLPARHAIYVRPFAEWDVLRSARRRAARRRRYTTGSAARSRGLIIAAIRFLKWIDEQHIELTAVTQDHVDLWLTTGPASRQNAFAFLRWSTERKITTPLRIEQRRSGLPTRFLDEDAYMQQLKRCLTEPSIPLDLRVAGALVRLYAMPLTRIVEITADRFHRDNDAAFLTIGKNPVILPPSLADLIEKQLTAEQTGLVPGDTHYLFPGRLPGRPLRAEPLGIRLLAHDLSTPAAHNTALANLITDLPAVVVSDMIGINIGTANQWLGYARTNWDDYLAIRTDDPPRATPSGPRSR